MLCDRNYKEGTILSLCKMVNFVLESCVKLFLKKKVSCIGRGIPQGHDTRFQDPLQVLWLIVHS